MGRWEQLKAYEEERQMPYITSVEQIGYDRGNDEAEQGIALKMLRKNLDLETIAEMTGIPIARLQELRSQLNPN